MRCSLEAIDRTRRYLAQEEPLRGHTVGLVAVYLNGLKGHETLGVKKVKLHFKMTRSLSVSGALLHTFLPSRRRMRMPLDAVLAQSSQWLSHPGGVWRRPFGTSFAPCSR